MSVDIAATVSLPDTCSLHSGELVYFSGPRTSWVAAVSYGIVHKTVTVFKPGDRSRHRDYATGWAVRGLNPIGTRGFSLFKNVRPGRLWVPPGRLCNGYRVLFPGVKLLRREDGHLFQSSAEGRNEWSYTSVPSMSSWHVRGMLLHFHYEYLPYQFSPRRTECVIHSSTFCSVICTTKIICYYSITWFI
jgi:hypothetical protein